MTLITNRHSLIGLDLGSRSIKAMQVSRARKKARIEATAIVPYATEERAIDAACVRRIRDVLTRQGFRGNRLVICAPADRLHVELLDLPPRTSGAPVDQLARAEMMRMCKLEGSNFELATWDLPAPTRGGTGTAVMGVALPHSDTLQMFNTFEAEGLCVEAIDVQACAVARACASRQHATELSAVLDLGFNHAALWFIRDGVVVFQRTFTDCGTTNVLSELTKRLSVDADVAEHLLTHSGSELTGRSAPQAATVQTQIARYADSLAEELESSFAYINHRYNDSQPSTLLAIGGGAIAGGLRDALSTRLNLQVEALSPMTLAECAPATLERCANPLLTTALGLALYEGD